MDKNSRIDSELLIMSVKKHENLWNKNKKQYHRKDLKEVSWNRICAELVEGWDSLNEQDKTLKQLILRKRWNNIRDYYKKDLGLQMNGIIGQPAMKRRMYVFSKKLEFLKPFYTERRNSRVFEPPSPDQEDANEEEEIREDEVKEETIEIYYTSCSEDDEPPRKKQKAKKDSSRHNRSFQASNSASREEESESDEILEDECDLLFLKSLAPDMKVLSHRQKLDFKLGILQLYKKIVSQSEHSETDPFYNVGKC